MEGNYKTIVPFKKCIPFTFRDTDKVPVIWTIVAMIIVLIVLNIDTMIYQPKDGAIGESLPVILPVIPTIVFNHLLFKRYRTLINSEDYASSATNDTLKQSIFRAKLSMAISSIYVTSQVLTVVQLIMDMVSYFMIIMPKKAILPKIISHMYRF